MPNSQPWNDLFVRFTPQTIAREYGVEFDEIRDFNIFVISKRKIGLGKPFFQANDRFIYPSSSEKVNQLLRSIKYPAGESFWFRGSSNHHLRSLKGIEFPEVMAIINMTPDSFYPKSRIGKAELLDTLETLKKNGVKIVDIGGQSTRPGSERISSQEEIKRIRSAVEASLNMRFIVSVDSFQVEVVRESLEMGANMINDVCGMENPEMGLLSKKYDVPIVIMHKKGDFKTMQISPHYDNVVEEIISFFTGKLEEANNLGIGENVILDPGIGFGKNLSHNISIIKNIPDLKLGRPFLIGLSRKSFIGSITGEEVDQRGLSSIIMNTIALINGADIIRVHDPEENMKLIKIIKKIKEA
ncbi:MAG: dihydropteroate synthase [Thermoplasmatales archaeon]